MKPGQTLVIGGPLDPSNWRVAGAKVNSSTVAPVEILHTGPMSRTARRTEPTARALARWRMWPLWLTVGVLFGVFAITVGFSRHGQAWWPQALFAAFYIVVAAVFAARMYRVRHPQDAHRPR